MKEGKKIQNKLMNIGRRVIMLVAGLFFLALGVSLSVRTDLGISPSSSLSFLLSKILSVSMGTVTVGINLVYILIQILLLKKDYRLMNLFQLIAVLLFGYFTDFTLSLLDNVVLSSYPARFFFCIVSCVLMGFGLYLEINAKILTMASEGALSVIADKSNKDFGFIKIINDVIFVISSLLISVLFFHKIEGIREGTILSAVLVGCFSRLCTRYLPLFRKEAVSEIYIAGDKYPLVITIERELGSGGHAIGEKLAKQLGIAFYDYDLIEKTAAETGLSNELISKKEERIGGLWYTLYDQSYGYTQRESETDEIFEAQKKVILNLASRESCVIVGRLGSFILKDRPNTFNVFISADRNYRVDELLKLQNKSRKEMMKIVEKEDSLRKYYCMHFTGRPWGLARHYHLCIDSSVYGREKTYDLIAEAIEIYRNNN